MIDRDSQPPSYVFQNKGGYIYRCIYSLGPRCVGSVQSTVGVTAPKYRDYPAVKLDIKLMFESVDRDILTKAKVLSLPASFEIVVILVPNHAPSRRH